MRYPGNYGFVPHTLSMTMIQSMCWSKPQPIAPGAVDQRAADRRAQIDDEGGGDEKIIAVPMPNLTMRYAHVTGIADMPKISIEQIQHFFEHYKDLEPGNG